MIGINQAVVGGLVSLIGTIGIPYNIAGQPYDTLSELKLRPGVNYRPVETITTQDQFSLQSLINQTARQLILTDLNNKNHMLTDYLNAPLILNFWTADCDTCETELRQLDGFVKDYGNKVNVIGVILGEDEQGLNPVNAREFAEGRELPIPIFGSPTGPARSTYRVNDFPTSFLISPDRRISHIHIGGIDYSDPGDPMIMALNGMLQQTGRR